MNPLHLIRDLKLGIKSLWLHTLRSLLTMLGVLIGVAAVITLVSLAEGSARETMKDIEKQGTRNIILTSVKPQTSSTPVSSSGSSALVYGLKYHEADRLLESLPTVERVVPVRKIPKTAKIRDRQVETQIIGTTPAWIELINRQMLAGRFLSWDDVESAANVCVISENLARRLLGAYNVVGQNIIIDSVVFTIIGVIRTESFVDPSQTQLDEDVYAPITTLRARYGEWIMEMKAGSFSREVVDLNQIILQVSDTDLVEDTGKTVHETLRKISLTKKIKERDDVQVDIPYSRLQQMKNERRRANFMVASIAAISLLVGGIGIMNIMLASVTERTREIGIRRAIGAKRGQIIMQFLIETVVLSSTGGLIGVIIGVAIPGALELAFTNAWAWGRPAVIIYEVVLASFGVSVGIGVIFGLYPAIRASLLDPIEALRHE